MTTIEGSFEALLPDTAAGRAAAWVMRHTRGRGDGLTEQEARAAHDSLPDDFDFDDYRQGFGWVADQLGEGFTVDSLDGTDPHRVVAFLASASGRRWEWTVEVAPAPPHGITRMLLQRALPPGVEIRVARPEDGPALREVARRAPLRLTDATIAIDPGEDYFASCRLMGDAAVTFVATHEDQPIGIHCGVSFPGRLGGTDTTFCLIAHSRLLPEFGGAGIWGRLNDTVFEHFQFDHRRAVGLAYVRPDNAAAQRLGGAESRWSTRVFRAVLDCAEMAGPSYGRPASPADAGRIAELLNARHGAEELYLPVTAERLAERLGRAPDLYGWGDLLLGDAAVVGVWASGEVHTRTPDDGEPIVSVRAAVLDHGAAEGADDEVEALLRAWCGRLAGTHVTHLGVFSSPASPGADRFRALACEIEEYHVMPPGVPEPPTAAANGIYVDPVYF